VPVERISILLHRSGDGHVAEVAVRDRATTTHRVRVSAAELAKYGGGDPAELVRRSFDFLLAREPNTSILRAFDLSAIERYYPDYPNVIRGR
jgi:hypothetical protein